jgi:uroporphyrinogen-III decarboxylase
MNPYRIKERWGSKICLNGGLDIQNMLPNAAPGEVRNEVKKLICSLGMDGGYILSGAHTIQADTPTRNIVAIVEAFNEVYGL